MGKDGFPAKNKFITKKAFQLLVICGSKECVNAVMVLNNKIKLNSMKIHFLNCCWFLVSKTSDGPCQWTESWILYRGWCWCWKRKTSEYIWFLYNFMLLSQWTVDKNQEWWPFSLGCKFTSFSCSQKHLPRFHFKTMWYHLCFPLPQNHVKPLKNWVGCDSWYGRAKEHTWLIVQPWKGLNLFY